MTQYAAYDDLSIYAVGPSPGRAKEIARAESMEPKAEFRIAKIHDDLAAWIVENGWNGNARSFDVVEGFIVDTTDRRQERDGEATAHTDEYFPKRG